MDETKAVWDDPVSRRVEEDRSARSKVTCSAVGAMDRVGVLLATIRRDCASDD